eukprot:8718521-Pyramimonas_sp.AAC.1
MPCIPHGGLRGFWGKKFQNGQDCPNASGHEPIKRILQGKDMTDSDKLNASVQEMYGLLGLAKE